MGMMTVGLVIAGVVVIGVVLLVLRWRLASGEQQALRHYQNALDTLRTVSDRMESSRPAIAPTSQHRSRSRSTTASSNPAPAHPRQSPADRTVDVAHPAYRSLGTAAVSAPVGEKSPQDERRRERTARARVGDRCRPSSLVRAKTRKLMRAARATCGRSSDPVARDGPTRNRPCRDQPDPPTCRRPNP